MKSWIVTNGFKVWFFGWKCANKDVKPQKGWIVESHIAQRRKDKSPHMVELNLTHYRSIFLRD